MADTILTIDDLNKLFQGVTLGILYPSALTSYYNVRISYQPQGQPAWLITEDVVSLFCLEVDDPYNRNRDQDIEDVDDEAQINTAYTTIINVQWVFYGPNSYSNARLVLDKLFTQTTHDTLADNNLYMLKDGATIRRAPELFQGQWWERTDLNVRFNELVIRQDTVHWVETVAIEIHDKDGLQKAFTVIENP